MEDARRGFPCGRGLLERFGLLDDFLGLHFWLFVDCKYVGEEIKSSLMFAEKVC